MLVLFPQYRLGLGLGWLLTAAVAGFMIRSGAAWYWPVLTVLLCGFLALALAELAATNHHRKLLLTLYAQGDPKQFLADYEPLLAGHRLAPGRELTLRAHLSNAYLALGESDKALQLLAEAPLVTGKEAARANALLAGNRCCIYLQRGDVANADRELETLRELEAENTDKRTDLFEALPQLRVRCALLHGVVTDRGTLEAAAAAAQSPLLRADLQLALIQLQLLQKHTSTAKNQLQVLAAGNPDLWAVQQGQRLLQALE